MDQKLIDCKDFLAFQDFLNKLRLVDDKILFKLNTALPSDSFSANVDKNKRCAEIYEELLEVRKMRLSLIQRCVSENQEEIVKMREKNSPALHIRNIQNTLRLMRSEMDVEAVVNERSEKAIHDRCRTFV